MCSGCVRQETGTRHVATVEQQVYSFPGTTTYTSHPILKRLADRNGVPPSLRTARRQTVLSTTAVLSLCIDAVSLVHQCKSSLVFFCCATVFSQGDATAPPPKKRFFFAVKVVPKTKLIKKRMSTVSFRTELFVFGFFFVL